jgi:hypothetical protein
MWRRLILGGLAPLALAGCEIGHLQEAQILVTTMPPSALCYLYRQNQPIATIARTPGVAMVSRDPGDVTILCRRPGYAEAVAVSHDRHLPPPEHTIGGPVNDAYETPIDIQLVPQAAAARR